MPVMKISTATATEARLSPRPLLAAEASQTD
jgi:hypothetical protein